MKRWIFIIFLGVAGGLLFRQIAVEGIVIATPSMDPTLPVGTQFFVDKISTFFRSPKRQEIILFTSPVDEDKEVIKRVIGLPGDRIEIKEKKVLIDGQPLDEPYTQYLRKTEKLVGDNIPEMVIPKDNYYVMGDNRDESKDSSSWKDPDTDEPIYFIHKNAIKGRLMNVLE